jgi:hypothetical protein
MYTYTTNIDQVALHDCIALHWMGIVQIHLTNPIRPFLFLDKKKKKNQTFSFFQYSYRYPNKPDDEVNQVHIH